MKNDFSAYNPLTHFVFFVSVLSVSMFIMDPVILLISFLCPSVYLIFAAETKKWVKMMLFSLPAAVLIAAINPFVSHRGITVLAYLPDGNPLTKESIFFGFAAAILMLSIINWFYFINLIFTSDRVICLFGRISPRLALLISMTLGFVGKFRRRFQLVRSAQNTSGMYSNKYFTDKVKCSLRILSAVIGWSLENAVDTADTMNSLGYGLKKRSFYTRFSFSFRDMLMILLLLVSDIIIFLSYSMGMISYGFYPVFIVPPLSPEALSVYFLYAAVCLIPLYISIKGEIKWKYTQSMI